MKADVLPVKSRMSRGRKRLVVDQGRILTAARELGEKKGWRAVTIRALAEELGYAAPVLYEHFRNKEGVLTQLAVEGLQDLDRELRKEVLPGADPAILVLVDRYWVFMLARTQMYRLMNGMDGVSVDGSALGVAAGSICEATGSAVAKWLSSHGGTDVQVEELTEAVWALLHGMASLHLGRSATFDVNQARKGVLQMLHGALQLVSGDAAGDSSFVGAAAD